MNNTNFSILILIAAAITLSQTSQATEFSAAAIGSTAYNSNVFATDGDEDSDMLLEAGIELELRSDPERRLDYLLNYRGDYQSYADTDEANAMEHRQRFRLRYDFDPVTQIIFNQRYRDVSNLQFDLADFDSGDSGIDISQNRYERTDLSVDLTRELSRRWSISGNLGYQTIDFKRNINRSDSDTTEVGVTINYLLSDKQNIGAGVRYANQDFDGADNRISAESDYFSLSLLWRYQFDEFSSLAIEGGPTWVDTEQDRLGQTVTNTNVGRANGSNLLRANFSACGIGGGQGQPIASLCGF
ncbi:MAG: outer membrane beta-barrel protein [bacterium]